MPQEISFEQSYVDQLSTLPYTFAMKNGRLRTLVGSLFTVITNAIEHRLTIIANTNHGLDSSLIPPGWAVRGITELLHTILDASSILPSRTDVGDYLAGVIDDAIGGE